MSENKKPKSVSFNLLNEMDKKILKHVQDVNFSAYVKELILADIEKRNQNLRVVQRTGTGGIKYVEIGNTAPLSQDVM